MAGDGAGLWSEHDLGESGGCEVGDDGGFFGSGDEGG